MDTTAGMTLKDSGARQEFSTGAKRDTQDGKPRLSLISPLFEQRLSHWLTLGATKYGDHNWTKGMPMSRVMDSLMRHLNAYREGRRDEDHLAALACNVMFLCHYEEAIRRGLLPGELLDLPSYVPEE